MNMSPGAQREINQIDSLINGTVLVHLFDESILKRKSTVVGQGVGRNAVYSSMDQEDPQLNSIAKVAKIADDLPEELVNKLQGKRVKVNYYSGKTYWKDDQTGELLVLMNVTGILSIIKGNKKKKKPKATKEA